MNGFRATLVLAMLAFAADAAVFRVATYNLENYLDQPTETRPHAKSPEARAKIRESIRAANPDVIALQEIGTTNALEELRPRSRTKAWIFHSGNTSKASTPISTWLC